MELEPLVAYYNEVESAVTRFRAGMTLPRVAKLLVRVITSRNDWHMLVVFGTLSSLFCRSEFYLPHYVAYS